MSEQAGNIRSYNINKRTSVDYLLSLGGWLLSIFSLAIIALIAYWAIKIPEKNINNLPIINAISGDIRFVPDRSGGKSFPNEDLSIYKNLENSSNIARKEDIQLNKDSDNITNFEKKIKNEPDNKSYEKELSHVIEDAIREVIDGDRNIVNKVEKKIENKDTQLYLGSFDSLSQADEFKKFIHNNNKMLLKNHKLKIFEKLQGNKKIFRVQLVNISSKSEAKKLCAILSSRQFSCLLFID